MARLSHVQAGQPFKPIAGDWNAFVDAARAHSNDSARITRPRLLDELPRTEIRVRNSSGGDRSRGDVLVPSSVAFGKASPDYRKTPLLIGRAYAATDAIQRPIVLLEPIKSGKTGRGVIAGWAVANVAGVTAGDPRGRLSAGAYTFAGGRGGPVELWHVDTNVAIVRIVDARPVSRVRGIATAAAYPGESITVGTLVGLDGPADPLGATITAANTHGWVVNSGAIVRAEFNETAEAWEAYQVDCYDPASGA